MFLFLLFFFSSFSINSMEATPKTINTGQLIALLLLNKDTLLARTTKQAIYKDSGWAFERWDAQTTEYKGTSGYINFLQNPDNRLVPPYFSLDPTNEKFSLINKTGAYVQINLQDLVQKSEHAAGVMLKEKLIKSQRWTQDNFLYASYEKESHVYNTNHFGTWIPPFRTYPVSYEQFSRSGKRGLLNGIENFTIEDLYTRNLLGSIPKANDQLSPSFFAWSPKNDESEIACPTKNVVEIYDINTGKKRLTIDPENGEVFYIQYETSGNQLFVATNNRISMFETVSGNLLKQFLYDTKDRLSAYPFKMFTIDPKETTIAAYITQANSKDDFVAVFDINLKKEVEEKKEDSTSCIIQ